MLKQIEKNYIQICGKLKKKVELMTLIIKKTIGRPLYGTWSAGTGEDTKLNWET